MNKFIIKNTKTNLYLARASGRYEWVKNADKALLINTSSAASNIAGTQARKLNPNSRWRRWSKVEDVRVIEIGVLIFPLDKQPFMDGVLNGNSN